MEDPPFKFTEKPGRMALLRPDTYQPYYYIFWPAEVQGQIV
jgi:hypothetical protein